MGTINQSAELGVHYEDSNGSNTNGRMSGRYSNTVINIITSVRSTFMSKHDSSINHDYIVSDTKHMFNDTGYHKTAEHKYQLRIRDVEILELRKEISKLRSMIGI